MQPQDIHHFWFEELKSKQHFSKDAALDAAIAQRFGATLKAAAQGELFAWRSSPPGRLAEIIVLDQFSRNIYRDTARAFAQDPIALVLAQELVASALDHDLPAAHRAFAYMPYMHSESAQVQAEGIVLFTRLGDENTLRFALHHQSIIERFGRYPHRNALVGRESTADELAFLSGPGSSF